MRFPYLEDAFISREKPTEYLLSETHPTGRSKARFFHAAGFDTAKVNILEQALISIAQNDINQTPWGDGDFLNASP